MSLGRFDIFFFFFAPVAVLRVQGQNWADDPLKTAGKTNSVALCSYCGVLVGRVERGNLKITN